MTSILRHLKTLGIATIFGIAAIAALHTGLPFAYAADATICDGNDITSVVTGCLHSSKGVFTGGDLITIVGNIIKLILGILGVLFVTLLIYAGFVWMVARGSDSEVKRSREMIIQSTIGLSIILTAYAVTYFVVDQLQKAVGITQ